MGGLSRRTLMARAGMAGAGAVLAQIPGFLARRGWLDAALAAETDLTRDTLNGLEAFVVAGPDAYSKAQGQSSKTPGAIAAKTTDALIELLDRFVGTSEGPTLPSSGGVATLLNGFALQVNPAAAGGQFLSPFARLKFAEKIEVFRRFEAQTEGSAREAEARSWPRSWPRMASTSWCWRPGRGTCDPRRSGAISRTTPTTP